MEAMTLQEIFRAKFRARVLADPRSVRTLADVSGYSESYISRVINGSKPNPTLAFVETMAVTLNVPLADLLQ